MCHLLYFGCGDQVFNQNVPLAELRTKIDHLRIERARYDLLYKKLDKTLTELRRDNALLMESATAAFNIRSVGDDFCPLLLLSTRTYLFLELFSYKNRST